MKRGLYITLRVFDMLVSVFSRAFNAFILGGSTHQTTSARMYIEAWPWGEWIIDAMFWPYERLVHGRDDHCRRAWEQEVCHAKRTLERATGLPQGTD